MPLNWGGGSYTLIVQRKGKKCNIYLEKVRIGGEN